MRHTLYLVRSSTEDKSQGSSNQEGWALADSVCSDCNVVKVDQHTTRLKYLSYLLSSPKTFSGFPYYTMACFLGVRKIKLPANTLASTLLLPVHSLPVLSPTISWMLPAHVGRIDINKPTLSRIFKSNRAATVQTLQRQQRYSCSTTNSSGTTASSTRPSTASGGAGAFFCIF